MPSLARLTFLFLAVLCSTGCMTYRYAMTRPGTAPLLVDSDRCPPIELTSIEKLQIAPDFAIPMDGSFFLQLARGAFQKCGYRIHMQGSSTNESEPAIPVTVTSIANDGTGRFSKTSLCLLTAGLIPIWHDTGVSISMATGSSKERSSSAPVQLAPTMAMGSAVLFSKGGAMGFLIPSDGIAKEHKRLYMRMMLQCIARLQQSNSLPAPSDGSLVDLGAFSVAATVDDL